MDQDKDVRGEPDRRHTPRPWLGRRAVRGLLVMLVLGAVLGVGVMWGELRGSNRVSGTKMATTPQGGPAAGDNAGPIAQAGRRWRPRRRGGLQPATIAAPPCPGCRGWHPAKRSRAAGRHRTNRRWRCPSRRRQRSARGSRPSSFGAGPRCPPSPFLARSCPTRIATPRSTRSSAASCDRCPSSWARRSRAGSRWRSFSASSWPRRR